MELWELDWEDLSLADWRCTLASWSSSFSISQDEAATISDTDCLPSLIYVIFFTLFLILGQGTLFLLPCFGSAGATSCSWTFSRSALGSFGSSCSSSAASATPVINSMSSSSRTSTTCFSVCPLPYFSLLCFSLELNFTYTRSLIMSVGLAGCQNFTHMTRLE